MFIFYNLNFVRESPKNSFHAAATFYLLCDLEELFLLPQNIHMAEHAMLTPSSSLSLSDYHYLIIIVIVIVNVIILFQHHHIDLDCPQSLSMLYKSQKM